MRREEKEISMYFFSIKFSFINGNFYGLETFHCHENEEILFIFLQPLHPLSYMRKVQSCDPRSRTNVCRNVDLSKTTLHFVKSGICWFWLDNYGKRGNGQHALKISPLEIPARKFHEFSDWSEFDDGLNLLRRFPRQYNCKKKSKKLQDYSVFFWRW